MWTRFCLCLVFLAFFAADPVTTECGLAPADTDDTVVLWTNLFSRINKIVSETSGLSESQNALTKTLLELIERQEKQETKLSEFIEKSDKRQEEQETKLSEFIEKSDKRQEEQEMKLSQFIEESKKYFSNLEEGHEKQDAKLSEFIEKSDKRQEKLETKQSEFLEESKKYFSTFAEGQEKLETQLSDFIKRSETSCSNLENWHEKQETQLSEFIKKSETSLSNLEKRQLSQWDESIAFMNSTQNDLLTMKNGFQQQQRKLSFLDQYLDNNLEWTTVLRRQDGSVDFYRKWNEYQKGFGDPDGEFFIGLDKLHNLTTLGEPQELLIVLKSFDNEKRIARYDKFKIGNAEEEYQLLELGTYSGDAGDSLNIHRDMKFTTHDNDNDDYPGVNCAKGCEGAWWFVNCYDSHLFGQYRKKWGVAWKSWKGEGSGLKFAEMKIRSKFN